MPLALTLVPISTKVAGSSRRVSLCSMRLALRCNERGAGGLGEAWHFELGQFGIFGMGEIEVHGIADRVS